MPLYFVTGNKGKYNELKQLIPQIEQLELDLLEIQETDPRKVIEEKFKEAFKQTSGALIVEDTSLSFEALKGLPGTFIKWFLQSLGSKGLFTMVEKLGNNKAKAKTIMAYAKNPTEVIYFVGEINGTIVDPEGSEGFGWDPIFLPDGSNKTFAQMTTEEKNKISHRFIAASKLAEYLKNNG